MCRQPLNLFLGIQAEVLSNCKCDSLSATAYWRQDSYLITVFEPSLESACCVYALSVDQYLYVTAHIT